MNLSKLIKRTLTTEKAMQAKEKNWFTLEVAKHATKGQIKQAVAAQFKVKVVRVNKIRSGGRTKAMVEFQGKHEKT